MSPGALDAVALVVVDAQVGFDDPWWGPRDNPACDANIARLVTQSVNCNFHGNPGLDAWLRKQDLAGTVVCGITTAHCCETTVRVGGNLGHRVLFCLRATHTCDRTGPDGVTYPAAELARTTAVDLHGEFAEVVATADLLGLTPAPARLCHDERVTESIVPAPEEHLTTGWEPDTPATDTLVRAALLAHASWPVHVAAALDRPHRTTDRWAAGRIADRGALSNPAFLLQPLTDPAGVLDELGDLFPPEVPFALLSPWPTPDLRGHGLVLLGHPPLMVRLPAPARPPAPPDLDVVEVRDEKRLAVAERVLVEGYPMPDLQPLEPGDLLAPALLSPTTRVWVGYVDGEPAGVAVAHLGPAATLVEYVATLPVARGRGAGAAVTWAATLADPDRPAVLLASDDGRPVYERMGYLAVERWTAWLRPGR